MVDAARFFFFLVFQHHSESCVSSASGHVRCGLAYLDAHGAIVVPLDITN
jgi:hypothetical protein